MREGGRGFGLDVSWELPSSSDLARERYKIVRVCWVEWGGVGERYMSVSERDARASAFNNVGNAL